MKMHLFKMPMIALLMGLVQLMSFSSALGAGTARIFPQGENDLEESVKSASKSVDRMPSSPANRNLELHNAFDAYERRFAEAAADLPEIDPWRDRDKTAIRSTVKSCLGIKEEWIPRIKTEKAGSIKGNGFRVDRLKFTSWEKVHGAASLYLPENAGSGKHPFVFIGCGHSGVAGKTATPYVAMAIRLARQGAVVLIPDNIGQGERTFMGHTDAVVPFACGMSVQGIIVMESMAWLNWAQEQPMVEASRMAICGNSGGGTLTLFLGALYPGLAAMSSSGYPCTFAYIAGKEKKHCHCNLIPGIVGQLEMWHVLSVFAPKPIYIFGGKCDEFVPMEYLINAARKVRTVYQELGSAENFHYKVFEDQDNFLHGWDVTKREHLSQFLADTLNLRPAQKMVDDTVDCLPATRLNCLNGKPAGALTIDDIAMNLSGIQVFKRLKLWDVYKPRIDSDLLPAKTLRGETGQILAQFEGFLYRKIDGGARTGI